MSPRRATAPTGNGHGRRLRRGPGVVQRTRQYVGAQQQAGHGTQTEEQFTLVKQGKHGGSSTRRRTGCSPSPTSPRSTSRRTCTSSTRSGRCWCPTRSSSRPGRRPRPWRRTWSRRCWPTRSRYGCRARATPPRPITAFPPHSSAKDINVTVDGTTATVNLTGVAASANSVARHQMATQLVWTLTGPPVLARRASRRSSSSSTASRGRRAPPRVPGGRPGPSPQTRHVRVQEPVSARHYSSSTTSPTASLVPVRIGGTGDDRHGGHGPADLQPDRRVTLGHGCTYSVQANVGALPPAQPHTVSPLSMVAVSPGRQVPGRGQEWAESTVTVWAPAPPVSCALPLSASPR